MDKPRIAVLDDWQAVAERAADWSQLRARAEVTIFREPLADPAAALAGFDALALMRERTPLPASLVEALPRLRFVVTTGARNLAIDLAACAARGIPVSGTANTRSGAATAEMAWALTLALARRLPEAEGDMRLGGFQIGVPPGTLLEGKRLGLVGLGKIGSRMAKIGAAFGMKVVAWSPNLTAERAAAAGARLATKAELFASADVVSLHLVLADTTRGVVGKPELKAMKRCAMLINTARGPLVERAALDEAVALGKIRVGLDVFHEEPLPENDPLRKAANVVLSPHLGYGVEEVYAEWYPAVVEALIAWLDGAPVRTLTP
jgi:phosphoglycerate dehydrogenase-like enzyme